MPDGRQIVDMAIVRLERPVDFTNTTVTFSGLFTVPYFCQSFSINLSMGDNTCLR